MYFAIARFNDVGALDPTWGVDGQSYDDMSTQSAAGRIDLPISMVILDRGFIVGGNTIIPGDLIPV